MNISARHQVQFQNGEARPPVDARTRALPSMQFNVLKYFLAVARTSSIRIASEQLFVAPSAVSRQIAALEADLGVALFERSSKGVRLTIAGELFAEASRNIVRQLEQVRVEMARVHAPETGGVAIHAAEGAITGIVFPVLSAWRQQFPAADLVIQAAGSCSVQQALLDDRCDMGITFNAESTAGIVAVASVPQRLVAVCAADDPAARRPHVTLQELCERRLGLLNETFGSTRILDAALAHSQLRRGSSLQLNSLDMAKAFVANRMGWTVLPEFAIAAGVGPSALACIPILSRAPLDGQLALCVRRDRLLDAGARQLLSLLGDAVMLCAAQEAVDTNTY
jgi:DNA-binding transcriptional LysR family regulator